MYCYYHPTAQATVTCISCGKAVCSLCVVDVSGMIHCQTCVSVGRISRPRKSTETNTLAIISLVLSVLSMCLGGIFFSVPAWILGNMAIKQIEENPNQEGIQLAKTGKFIGLIVTILFISVAALYVLFLFGVIGLSFLESSFQ